MTGQRAADCGDDRDAATFAAEGARLAALARYDVLDTAPEEAFDDLCQLAAQLCGTPTALVSLVDEGRQWFKARLGLDVCSSDRDIAFCAHALDGQDVLVVPDATADPRFRHNPLVTGPPHIRFYAGAPLITPDGLALGTLCVIDTIPRQLDGQQLGQLAVLARQVMTQLEHRRQAQALALEIAAREVAETAHAATRRVLDGVLEHTDVMVYVKDADGRFLLANGALCSVIGKSAAQVLDHTDADLFGAEEARVFLENDRAVATSGSRQVLAETLTHPDGSVHSYLSTKFPLRDNDGQVYGVAGVSTDVTEITQARTEMAESKQRWKSLVENSPVAVAVYGATDLRFRYANEPAARLYGAESARELIGRSFLSLFADEHRSAYLRRQASILVGETVLAAEATIHGVDGCLRDVEVNAGLVTWNGEPAVQVEMHDITTRVAAAKALRAGEDRFRVLFDTAPIGMMEALPDGTLLAVNPTLCTILGYQAHELIGRPLSMVVDPTDHAPMDAALSTLLGHSAPTSSSVQRIYRRKDGTALPVLLGVNSVWDADGRALRGVGTVVDISARVAAEDRLRETTAELARRQAFTDALLDTVQVGIVACDADGHLTTFNNAARTWHGVDADTRLDPTELARHYDLFHANGTTPLPMEQIPLLVALRDGVVKDLEMVIAPKGRPATRVLCTGQVLRDEHGTVQGAVVAMHDVTVLRADEQRLREHAAFHDGVLAASPDLIYLLDPVQGRNLWSSRNLLDMLGYTTEQVHALGSSIYATLVHPDDVPRLRASNVAGADLADGQVVSMRYRAMAADGGYRWLSRRATPFRRDDEGRITQLLAIARDVTDLVEVEERLTKAALHDPLTGLPNRTLLTDRLELALRRSARTGTSVAILFCDLDGFKNVNDTAGHAAGDAVLRATADRLRGVLRPQDTVARVGGDEFVVILEAAATAGRLDDELANDPLPGTPGGGAPDAVTASYREAVAIAGRIKAVLAQPVAIHDHEHIVTVSIGLTFGRAGDDPEEVLRDADSAMYKAKSRGKDRHEIFSTR
ncbi:PAS domain S-box protein [Dermatophilaceae bacterium Soc4.6]